MAIDVDVTCECCYAEDFVSVVQYYPLAEVLEACYSSPFKNHLPFP